MLKLENTNPIINNPTHRIDIRPMPTPRPRSRLMPKRNGSIMFASSNNKTLRGAMSYLFVSIYSPTEYDNYKTTLAIYIRRLKIQPDNYSFIVVHFYLPYPKSTPKKDLIEGKPHFKKPDLDNLLKGFQDALVDSHVLLSDGFVSEVYAAKRYTINPTGRIEFTLIK